MIPTQNKKVELPQAPVTDLTDPASDTRVARSSGSGRVSVGSSEPFLTSLAVAFRFVQPTWRNYITYVDAEARTGNEDARRYLRTWQSLPPKERLSVVPEQVCEMADVLPADLISWVSKHVWLEGTAASSMVLSFNKPRVLDAVATAALDPENGRHAEMFLKAAGVLSQGGGRGGASPVSIYNLPVASSGSVALAGAKSDSTPVSASGLRSMDADIVGLSEIMQHNQVGKSRAETEPDDDDPDDDSDESEDEDDD